MPRLLFTKTDEAVWMSHLDLMRLFQRAFKRAGLPLTHTQGYNPRPSVSIALPLSVGVESVCELLDFDLTGESIPCNEITQRLNKALVPGVQVLMAYETGGKIKDLALLDAVLTLEYDTVVDAAAVDQIQDLFTRPQLTVEKKGKNGMVQQDLIPLIRSIQVDQEDDHVITIQARICCQNPSLNPMQIPAAISLYLPEQKPDHVLCRRMEIFDSNHNIFR